MKKFEYKLEYANRTGSFGVDSLDDILKKYSGTEYELIHIVEDTVLDHSFKLIFKKEVEEK